jgi:hypothetical protein
MRAEPASYDRLGPRRVRERAYGENTSGAQSRTMDRREQCVIACWAFRLPTCLLLPTSTSPVHRLRLAVLGSAL